MLTQSSSIESNSTDQITMKIDVNSTVHKKSIELWVTYGHARALPLI